MRRLLAIATVLFALSAGIAHPAVPGFGTEDTCAAVFTEDAAACGGYISKELYMVVLSPPGSSYPLRCYYHLYAMPNHTYVGDRVEERDSC
jgi:hypothetical protein